jgi:Ca2+-binding RTX toxin-like protein
VAHGVDTVEVNGGNGDEQFTTTANWHTRALSIALIPLRSRSISARAKTSCSTPTAAMTRSPATGNLAALIQITVDGGAGDDTLLGSNGTDLLLGGDNNDFIDGQQGNDTVFLGAGDDTFQWDPGDGSDTVEGQAGNDRMVFNGANIAEIFDVSANGSRVRFTRNIATVTMDLDDVEILEAQRPGRSRRLHDQ